MAVFVKLLLACAIIASLSVLTTPSPLYGTRSLYPAYADSAYHAHDPYVGGISVPSGLRGYRRGIGRTGRPYVRSRRLYPAKGHSYGVSKYKTYGKSKKYIPAGKIGRDSYKLEVLKSKGEAALAFKGRIRDAQRYALHALGKQYGSIGAAHLPLSLGYGGLHDAHAALLGYGQPYGGY